MFSTRRWFLLFNALVPCTLLSAASVNHYAGYLDIYKYSRLVGPRAWDGGNELIGRCSKHWRNSTLDHFSWVRRFVARCSPVLVRNWLQNSFDHGLTGPYLFAHLQAEPAEGRWTYPQRYYVCDDQWAVNADGSRGPIFFYVGNEADVTL